MNLPNENQANGLPVPYFLSSNQSLLEILNHTIHCMPALQNNYQWSFASYGMLQCAFNKGEQTCV